MSRARVQSSPDLLPSSPGVSRTEDHSLEGVAANVMLLLKLIQDNNEACAMESDDRKTKRVGAMIAILDDVKARIQQSQTRKREAQLRRCLSDLRPRSNVPRRPAEPVPIDEKEQLRKHLSASLEARKNLEMMCSSLGKEKEIMACELSKKVHEQNELEEMISDLKAQNEMLLTKLQKERKLLSGGLDGPGNANAVLQDKNRELSEQLLKSLDGYRALKRRLKEAQEDKMRLRSSMEEIREDISVGLDLARGLRNRTKMSVGGGSSTDGECSRVEEQDIDALVKMFKDFELKVSECVQRKR